MRIFQRIAPLCTAVLLFALAADVSGTWTFAVESPAGSGEPTFTFKQDGEKLTGRYKGRLGEADVTGKVEGDKISFEFKASAEGQELTIRYSGTIESPTTMKGTVEFGDFGSGTWTAKKNSPE